MQLEFLFDRFREHQDSVALIWREQEFTYGWLADQLDEARSFLSSHDIPRGATTVLRGDFTPTSTAYLLALVEYDCIVVPISYAVKDREKFYSTAEVEYVIELGGDKPEVEPTGRTSSHEFLIRLKDAGTPGLILFSSGSTGESKAAVHDFSLLLNKFMARRKTLRTITFLLFDHIGGINTLFYILSNVGTIIAPEDRAPEEICRLIEKYRVELLPTSPTFINMILLTRAYEKHDISSLKLMTYGTEAMPEQTLKAFHARFPEIELKQTYGLSELGILRSKSRSSDSLWFKVGGEDYETRIVDGILQIRAKCAMLGYLNAPSPFDAEGWFDTQDKVEIDGEWLKILGRQSDLINVGGEKVYPVEVESVLMEIDNIVDASVYGVKNAIMGHVVAARVKLREEETLASLRKRVRTHCRKRMQRFKVPAIIEIVDEVSISDRFKRVR